MMCVLLIGNPCDGFVVCGPFETFDEATSLRGTARHP